MALPPSLYSIHNVFDISILTKFVLDPDQIIKIMLLELQEDLTNEEGLLRIVDRKE